MRKEILAGGGRDKNMFVLVEPLSVEGLSDTPDLGCAMLLASWKERGIKATLVKGQTFWLGNMFMKDADELWDLLYNLDEKTLKRLEISKVCKRISEKRSWRP